VGGAHGSIYKNAELRSALATLLGHRGVLAAAPLSVEVAIRDHVVTPGDALHFVLTPSTASVEIVGELCIERAILNSGRGHSFAPVGQVYPIAYRGVVAERLALATTAPNIPGVYRLAFYAARDSVLHGSEEFFVQNDA
jgi:hypothetical protein